MGKVNINFRKELFNDVYLPYLTSNYDYEVYWGGGGSGKSVFIAQKQIIKCLRNSYHRLIYCRKTAESIRDSQFQLFKDVITDWGLHDYFKIYESTMDIVCVNGNKMLAQGLDNLEKIKSIQEPTDIWVEEATDCDKRDIEQLGLRIRTKKVEKVQYILSFNPIDKNHWINSYFFPEEAENQKIYTYKKTSVDEQTGREISLSYLLLHTTYLDNRFLPDAYKARLEELIHTNPIYHQIYKLGRWGKVQMGGEFYKKFSYEKHVKKVQYNPEMPLHVSFDFNAHPYCTMTVWQLYGKKAIQIDEICSTSPENNSTGVCKAFKRRYYNHNAGLFYYGDPSARHDDTRDVRGWNDYNYVEQELADYHPVSRVAIKAPPIVPRGMFINCIFDVGFEGIEITINDKCYNTIADYENQQETHEGLKEKKKAKDPSTGKPVEKYGHCSDANDYLLCQVFSDEFAIFNTGNRKLDYIIGSNQKRNW